jgi:hypothetical protein
MQYEVADCALSPVDDPDALKRGIGSPIREMNSHFGGVGALARFAREAYDARERWTRVGERRSGARFSGPMRTHAIAGCDSTSVRDGARREHVRRRRPSAGRRARDGGSGRRALVTFTDLAFDGTSILWRITHHCHAVPETMAGAARDALAGLDDGTGRPVAFVAAGGGAVALLSGGVPFGAGPAARVLAQASARLSPPSRLIVMCPSGGGPPLAATMLLPWSADSAIIPVGDLVALAAVVGVSSDTGSVDPALIRMAWSGRPAVITTFLPGSTRSAAHTNAMHECILGLAAEGLGRPQPGRRAAASSPRGLRTLTQLALGQPQP